MIERPIQDSDGLIVARAYHRSQGRYFRKQWMNHITDLTYTSNPSIAPMMGVQQNLTKERTMKVNI